MFMSTYVSVIHTLTKIWPFCATSCPFQIFPPWSRSFHSFDSWRFCSHCRCPNSSTATTVPLTKAVYRNKSKFSSMAVEQRATVRLQGHALNPRRGLLQRATQFQRLLSIATKINPIMSVIRLQRSISQ